MNPNKYICPECGSEDTLSMPMAYKHGHATVGSRHRKCVGYRENSDGSKTPVYDYVRHDDYMETDFAAEAAPPKVPKEPEKEATGCFMAGLIFLPAASISFYLARDIAYYYGWGVEFKTAPFAVITWCILTYATGWLMNKVWHVISGKNYRYARAKARYQEDMQTYHEDYAVWEHMFICRRCGHKY